MTQQVSIRDATSADLPALHALASAALTHDTFSADLLAEKLFANPRPQRDVYRTLIAEVGREPAGMMQCVTRSADAKGWIGVFAVDERHRRRKIATDLLQTVLNEWRQAGVQEAEVLAIPGNYFTPGLDPRYTPALAFLEKAGFLRFRDCVNMTAPLDQPFETASDEHRLVAAGVELRRASAADAGLLDAYFTTHFGQDWRLEAELAMNNDSPGLHLALRDGRVIAFSAHSTQNREWGFFGPMGTAPEARGLGMGRVLLRRCLNDLRDAGHRTAVIPWVGPIAFYSYHADCRVSRVFWRYRLDLKSPPGA